MFKLDGIAPAPRGVPQIEVTFDIDANGIVHVSAKDLGTGKEQDITITSSTNMSKEDIDKAVKEAEAFAAEDAKKKEDVDARNQADQMCFQCEKALGEFGDKVDAADKSECEGKINDLKEALKGSDIEAIKAKNKDLEECFQKIATKVYQQAGAQAQGAQGFDPSSMGNMGGAAQQSTNNGGDDVIDADFKDAE